MPTFSGILNAKRRQQKIRNGPLHRPTKSEVAASPLPPRGPKRGRKGYVTPAFSGIPNAKRGEKKIRKGPRKRGTKSEVAASPLPSRWPKRGRKCYVTPAFSGIPNANCREEKISHGPQQRRTKSQWAASPLPSRGSPTPSAGRKKNQKWSPTKGNKIRSGCLTPAFSGAQKRAEMLGLPCTPGDPQRQARGAKNRDGPLQRGTKSEVAASTLPSRGPKRGQDCYVVLAFSGIPNAKRGQQKKLVVVPNKGEQNQKWLPHPCLLGGPKEGGNARSPLHSRGSPTPSAGSKKQKRSPTKEKQNQKWLPQPCLLGGPKEGKIAPSPLHSRGSPTPSAGSKKN